MADGGTECSRLYFTHLLIYFFGYPTNQCMCPLFKIFDRRNRSLVKFFHVVCHVCSTFYIGQTLTISTTTALFFEM